jgi:hypothetical protein
MTNVKVVAPLAGDGTESWENIAVLPEMAQGSLKFGAAVRSAADA